ncbi:MAG TPA: hypothetical protein VN756_07015 [Solirubrobacterales bacterium]|nr:hypothetical protein [Solirubrobacterales bacterium]
MRNRSIAVLVLVVAAVAVSAASAGAALIGIYRNSMESEAQRAQVVKLSGERCGRGGSDHAVRIVVGKRTRECAYRTPVVGRDLEIGAIGRLLSNTPQAVQRKAFLAINLRTGGAGAGYQLAVFPMQAKAQLRKVLPDGQIQYLHVEKDVRTRGLNRANELRLRAFNVTSGPEKGSCHVLAFVAGQLVADVTDSAAGELEGRAAGFSLGALGNAKGAAGSFDDVVVRVPSPF